METIKKHKTLQILWVLVFGAPKLDGWEGLAPSYMFFAAIVLGPSIGFTYGYFYDKEHKLLAAGKGLCVTFLIWRVWLEFEYDSNTPAAIKGIVQQDSQQSQTHRKPVPVKQW